jgi:hypothetical protein
LDLALNADAEVTARDLATREVGCCSFFSFELGSAGSDVMMRIGVPELRAEALDALEARAHAVAAGGLR